jgi:hypothetical protein
VRAYRGDLIAFAAHHDDEIGDLAAAPIRAYLSEIAGLSPATRKAKRAAVASFCRWAVRHDLLDANPIDKVDSITVPKTLPRPADPAQVQKVFAVICTRRPRKDLPIDRLRDRVLFETAYVCALPCPQRLHQRAAVPRQQQNTTFSTSSSQAPSSRVWAGIADADTTDEDHAVGVPRPVPPRCEDHELRLEHQGGSSGASPNSPPSTPAESVEQIATDSAGTAGSPRLRRWPTAWPTT